ncbi:MAG: ATP-dependent dethiobiotin synthetase BioD, partial [Stagnimonas sp.]|nr:ATP-dependent dethiobiotin synthetase BioD [Stagnimonas sp.]
WVIAEGAGGWLTPLAPELSLGDWVAGQGWPVLLVVELRLGCLNHALLSAEAIRRRTRLAGWVANVRNPGMDRLEANLDSLSARLGAPAWVQRQAPMAPVEVLAGLLAPLEGRAALN